MAHLLLVEDHEHLVELYEYELTREGHVVMSCRTGADALAEMQGRRPDLVVLDLLLPDMPGAVLLQRLSDLHPDVPVIINTAYAEVPPGLDLRLARRYIIKSGDLHELREAIATALGPPAGCMGEELATVVD
jgi:DNA-binding response OmpR family regulator